MKYSEAKRRYLIELGASMVLYVLSIAGPLSLAEHMKPGLARTLLLIMPALAVFVVVWVIARQFSRMDEFLRLRSLESIAIAGAVTAGLALTYGLLEGVGFPRLSMFWVWGSMGFVWATHSCFRSMFSR